MEKLRIDNIETSRKWPYLTFHNLTKEQIDRFYKEYGPRITLPVDDTTLRYRVKHTDKINQFLKGGMIVSENPEYLSNMSRKPVIESLQKLNSYKVPETSESEETQGLIDISNIPTESPQTKTSFPEDSGSAEDDEEDEEEEEEEEEEDDNSGDRRDDRETHSRYIDEIRSYSDLISENLDKLRGVRDVLRNVSVLCETLNSDVGGIVENIKRDIEDKKKGMDDNIQVLISYKDSMDEYMQESTNRLAEAVKDIKNKVIQLNKNFPNQTRVVEDVTDSTKGKDKLSGLSEKKIVDELSHSNNTDKGSFNKLNSSDESDTDSDDTQFSRVSSEYPSPSSYRHKDRRRR